MPEIGDTRITIDCDSAQGFYLLIIHDANREDAGEYIALAANEHGSFKYRITVIVAADKETVKPIETKIMKTITTKRTVSVVEETLVDGKVVERTVKNEITEEKPDDALLAHEQTSVDKSCFHIEEIEDDAKPTRRVPEEKTRKAVPWDEESSDEGEPPKFVQPPEPVYVDIGEIIKLICQVSGWRTLGDRSVAASSYTLVT